MGGRVGVGVRSLTTPPKQRGVFYNDSVRPPSTGTLMPLT